MSFSLGTPITLGEYIDRCMADRRGGEWMVFRDQDGYRLDMLLYPVILEDWILDEAALAHLEEQLRAAGYRNCLTAEQLEDTVLELEARDARYGPEALEQALNSCARHIGQASA